MPALFQHVYFGCCVGVVCMFVLCFYQFCTDEKTTIWSVPWKKLLVFQNSEQG